MGKSFPNDHVILTNISSDVTRKKLYHSTNLKLYTAKLPTSTQQKIKFPRRHQQRNVEVPSVPLSLRKKQVKSTKDLETEVPNNRDISFHNTEEDNRNGVNIRDTIRETDGHYPFGIAFLPRDIQKIKGDGNCFFRALSYTYVLLGSECSQAIMRQRMRQPCTSKKLDRYMNENVNEYLRRSKRVSGGVWATYVEIMSTASLLKTDI